MKEDFLHYLWKYKKFDTQNLKTSKQESITILNSGNYLQMAGPDFFNAQVIINHQKWAGNVEIHLKSSDWYVHHHEKDVAYESVILHVVWEHDTEIFRKDNSEIPVLELKKYVLKEVLENYQSLITQKSWIFCEKQLQYIDNFTIRNWQERLFFERLERKSKPIFELLEKTNSDWETVLFNSLAKNFGLNTNGDSFLKIAQSIPFSIIRKESFEVENLEALFFGCVGLLDSEFEDAYFKNLKLRFYYLLNKYQIEKSTIAPVQFFKHRPDNFPTIRLSQLANVYHTHQNLFSKIIFKKSIQEIYTIFKVSVSNYWQTHYLFDKESTKKSKLLSKSFIDLIVINSIIPIQFAYSQKQDKEDLNSLIDLIQEIDPENNGIIQKFNSFGIKVDNAFDSQSLIQLKNVYCNHGKCLDCSIGVTLLKTKKTTSE